MIVTVDVNKLTGLTWMFLRHLILASTLFLSVPSSCLSSVSDIPLKLGGGWGGGTEKGRKGGNMKGGLAAAPPAGGGLAWPP